MLVSLAVLLEFYLDTLGSSIIGHVLLVFGGYFWSFGSNSVESLRLTGRQG